MGLIYTPLYAGLLGLIVIVLAFKVVLLRRKHKVGIGTGKQNDLGQAIRVHGNATEYVPLALILLACAEWVGANSLFINICGIGLVVGRILHAYGLGKSIGVSFGRFYGTLMTWLIIIVLASYNIVSFIGKNL